MAKEGVFVNLSMWNTDNKNAFRHQQMSPVREEIICHWKLFQMIALDNFVPHNFTVLETGFFFFTFFWPIMNLDSQRFKVKNKRKCLPPDWHAPTTISEKSFGHNRVFCCLLWFSIGRNVTEYFVIYWFEAFFLYSILMPTKT